VRVHVPARIRLESVEPATVRVTVANELTPATRLPTEKEER